MNHWTQIREEKTQAQEKRNQEWSQHTVELECLESIRYQENVRQLQDTETLEHIDNDTVENWIYKPIWDAPLYDSQYDQVECTLISQELTDHITLMYEAFAANDIMVEREVDQYVKAYNIGCQCHCDHPTCQGQIGYAPRYTKWLCESCLLDAMEDDYKYNHTLHLL